MMYKAYSNIQSKGSADRIADRIADSIIDTILFKDIKALVKSQVILTPECVTVYIDGYTTACDAHFEQTIRSVLNSVNSPKFSAIAPDSYRINIVRKTRIPLRTSFASPMDEGASCSCTVSGYATNETEAMIPLHEKVACLILDTLDEISQEGILMPYLGNERRCQVGVRYDHGHPTIESIHVHTQADSGYSFFQINEEKTKEKLSHDLQFIVMERMLSEHAELKDCFNPNVQCQMDRESCYSIHGPFETVGLSGKSLDHHPNHSGLTPNDTRRSATLAARNVAKNLVAAGVAKEVQVELTYMQGVAAPIYIQVDTMGTNLTGLPEEALARMVDAIFDLRHQPNIARLRMAFPIYSEYAGRGFDGYSPKSVRKTIFQDILKHESDSVEVTLFPWEKCDKVEEIQNYLASAEGADALTQ